MILSPKPPAGRIVTDPVSLRDLPATVVDQLGLSADSPFPGRSLAAFWPPRPGQPPPEVTPALSEQSGSVASRPHESGPSPGYQISPGGGSAGITSGTAPRGSSTSTISDTDGAERVNLADSAGGSQVVDVYRKMLLDALTDNPGSIEMENTYLKSYRQRLKSIVEESASPRRGDGSQRATERRARSKAALHDAFVEAMMDPTPSGVGTGKPARRIPLSPTPAVVLAISIGLCGGYVDLLVMCFVRSFRDPDGYFRTGRDFLWTVPIGHLVMLNIVAVPIAVFIVAAAYLRWAQLHGSSRRSPSGRTSCVALYGVASLLLAAGLGRLTSGPITALVTQPARRRLTLAGLLGVLCLPGRPLVRSALGPGVSRGESSDGASPRRAQRGADRLGHCPRV